MSDPSLSIPSRAGTATLGTGDAGTVQLQHDRTDQVLKHAGSDGIVRAMVDTTSAQELSNKTLPALASESAVLTTPVIDGVTYSALNDRQLITEAFAVDGAALHAAVLPAVVFPADAIIVRAILNITTVATAACTIDVGYTAVTATTSSDTLLDGIDANAAIGVFDSMNAALDAGANAKAQAAAAEKWVTIDEKTGDSTGLVAVLYVQYFLV